MGGRINTLDIPNYLGVNIEVVDRSLDNLTKKSKINLINGQLISSQYLDLIMEELYELISDKGQVFLSELTSKYNLPLNFIKETIEQRMEQ